MGFLRKEMILLQFFLFRFSTYLVQKTVPKAWNSKEGLRNYIAHELMFVTFNTFFVKVEYASFKQINHESLEVKSNLDFLSVYFRIHVVRVFNHKLGKIQFRPQHDWVQNLIIILLCEFVYKFNEFQTMCAHFEKDGLCLHQIHFVLVYERSHGLFVTCLQKLVQFEA